MDREIEKGPRKTEDIERKTRRLEKDFYYRFRLELKRKKAEKNKRAEWPPFGQPTQRVPSGSVCVANVLVTSATPTVAGDCVP